MLGDLTVILSILDDGDWEWVRSSGLGFKPCPGLAWCRRHCGVPSFCLDQYSVSPPFNLSPLLWTQNTHCPLFCYLKLQIIMSTWSHINVNCILEEKVKFYFIRHTFFTLMSWSSMRTLGGLVFFQFFYPRWYGPWNRDHDAWWCGRKCWKPALLNAKHYSIKYLFPVKSHPTRQCQSLSWPVFFKLWVITRY